MDRHVKATRGDVASLTLPDSSVESWTYDGTGNTTAYTNPLSQAIAYTYDNAGRQTGVDYPTGTDTTFGYDDDDRTSSMVDATGTTSWTYNAADELTELDQPNGTVEYTYNSAGQRATMVDVGVGTTTYGYDGYGRLSTITNPYSEVTTFAYDAAGRLDIETKGNGVYTDYGYDTRSRVNSLVHRDAEGNGLSSESYSYNAVNDMVSKVVDGVTTTYDYDAVSQLIEEDRSGYNATYTYDANGNRTSRTVNSVTESYAYDAADKLTAITGGSNPRTFDYDDAGRTVEITSGAGTRYFAYDYESRLTSLTLENSSVHTYSYNGLDTRTGRNEAGTTRTYRRDGAYVTDPVLGDGSSNFTPAISSRSGSTSSFFQADFLGSVTKQTGSGQTVTTSRQYDAFGNLTSGSSAAPFGFAGRWGYQEDASGYKLLGHRYYDPSTGRFLTRDPAKDGRNWYGYCGNNPTLYVDPSGEVALGAVLVVALIVLITTPAVAPSGPNDLTPEAMNRYKQNMWAITVPLAGSIAAGGIGGAVGKTFAGRPVSGLKIDWDKQGKHIPGHKNEKGGRSPLTHPDPQKLVDYYGGTGRPVSGQKGKPGYRERVDFGEPIGITKTGIDDVGQSTTQGIIHYGKRGVHIVPSRPK